MTDEYKLLDHLDIFLGASSPTVARVYARVSGLADAAGLRLSGQLYGPRCSLSKTLPARIPFRDLGAAEAGGSMLAEAILPDPCFWSTDLPAVYRATIELRRGNSVIARAERDYGMQAIGTHGRDLWCCGKRWVLRAVHRSSVEPQAALDEWRDAFAAMVVSHPNDELCAAASAAGLFLVARLDNPAHDPATELRRLARWSAVGIAIVDSDVVAGDGASREGFAGQRSAAADLLLAQPISADFAKPLAAWAQIAVCDVSDPQAFSELAARLDRPVLAFRQLDAPLELPAARAACDRLQSDLVRVGDFAGYLV